jgi:hypothetical protein
VAIEVEDGVQQLLLMMRLDTKHPPSVS